MPSEADTSTWSHAFHAYKHITCMLGNPGKRAYINASVAAHLDIAKFLLWDYLNEEERVYFTG